jgi:hypothetical protein
MIVLGNFGHIQQREEHWAIVDLWERRAYTVLLS